jgi:hypothetical protein
LEKLFHIVFLSSVVESLVYRPAGRARRPFLHSLQQTQLYDG